MFCPQCFVLKLFRFETFFPFAHIITREGATIVDVVYSCHPTPEGHAVPGCTPALRIQSENRAVDFLVDDEERIVVETVTEITSNSKSPGE